LKKIKVFWIANPKKKYQFWLENDSYGLVMAIKKCFELSLGEPCISGNRRKE